MNRSLVLPIALLAGAAFSLPTSALEKRAATLADIIA
jgi:hypothetical protein